MTDLKHLSDAELDRYIATLKKKIMRPWTKAAKQYPDGFLEAEAEKRRRRNEADRESAVNEARSKAEIAALNKQREMDELTIRGVRFYHAHETND